jgi:hypothetical protein
VFGDGDFDLPGFPAVFFTNGGVDTIAGPRGRIEARLYDIDFLGAVRLTAQGVIQWDQPRGTGLQRSGASHPAGCDHRVVGSEAEPA